MIIKGVDFIFSDCKIAASPDNLGSEQKNI